MGDKLQYSVVYTRARLSRTQAAGEPSAYSRTQTPGWPDCQGERGLHQVNRASCSSEALKCEKVPVHAASAYKSSSGHYCVVFGCQNKQRNRRILLSVVCDDHDAPLE